MMFRAKNSVPKHTITQWKNTVKLIGNLFNEANVDYILHGSGACVFHGVTFPTQNDNPSDIDITVINPKKACTFLLKKSQIKNSTFTIKESESSTMVVKKFLIRLKDGSPSIELELTSNEDFGFNANKVKKEGVYVTSLVETLMSLYYRMSKSKPRAKDIFAFKNLITDNAEYLQKLPELLNHSNGGLVKEILTGIDQVLQEKKNAALKVVTTNAKNVMDEDPFFSRRRCTKY